MTGFPDLDISKWRYAPTSLVRLKWCRSKASRNPSETPGHSLGFALRGHPVACRECMLSQLRDDIVLDDLDAADHGF
jgi:hypothetical protein